MGTLISLFLALIVAVAIGAGATWYLRRVRLPREETAEGIAALSDMRWRDFIKLVLDVLAGRGFTRVNDPEATSDEADIPLRRDGETWLLSSKHGASYVLGSSDITEFANTMRLRGAQGGLLATPGTFAPEARRHAEAERIELLDGPSLWPELRERLPETQRSAIGARARIHSRQKAWFGWLLGVIAGAAVFLLVHGNDSGDASVATPVVAPVRAPSAKAKAAATQIPANDGVWPAPGDVDTATTEKDRSEAARAIGSLPMVSRALWSSQSTLLVYLNNTSADAKSAICPLLERYPELGASRVQLQPPEGSGEAVRFFQCRAY
ncbi:restriction endonuclease [Pseudoluteimonas lycopersici]|uniref:Restriction endonuclease n=1 Tax=Pseudoluteimonas lycopersici TaxID=1324796 RepID=A0A516V382_9GAMM|nr:restriction endonuclease [Lysobacter lycopersici]QDQ72975.1 restriction endonuclease [Lysobacter lycopersici]